MTQLLDVFTQEQARLVGLAYRMLGSRSDAEDVVQESWLRLAKSTVDIERPEAWLTTVVTRLAIDRLRVLQRERASYVGPWLAEPLEDVSFDDVSSDPEQQVLLAESLTFGFLRILERLSPLERAVFLLHDVFAVPLADVSATVERSPTATRQLAKRARDHVQQDRPRYAVEPHDVEALTDAFMIAALAGDLEKLRSLLHDDAVQINDGGPKFRASRYPVIGRDRVARFVLSLVKKLPAGGEVHKVRANGQFGYYTTVNGEPYLLLVVLWVDGKIASSHGVRNEDKLRSFHRAWLAQRVS